MFMIEVSLFWGSRIEKLYMCDYMFLGACVYSMLQPKGCIGEQYIP